MIAQPERVWVQYFSPAPLGSKISLKCFPMRVSVFQADSNGANDRAIDLSRCKAPGNALLHLRCLCHRVHTSAKKTFELRLDVLSGLTRCLLVLGQSTAQCLCAAAATCDTNFWCWLQDWRWQLGLSPIKKAARNWYTII